MPSFYEGGPFGATKYAAMPFGPKAQTMSAQGSALGTMRIPP
jgi:hypothetical protein